MMRSTKALLAGAAILSVSSGTAAAADMDYQPAIQQLVVSGMVESWYGYTFYNDIEIGDEDDEPNDFLANGNSVRLSLPLGSNLSLQMDFDHELNTDDLSDRDDDDNFRHSFQGIGHLSWRNPESGLLGVFGGAGRGAADTDVYSMFVVGGEGQLYLDNLTLYVQGGFLDSQTSRGEDQADDDSLRDAGFARGVVRWFQTENSRWQGEVSFASGTVASGEGDDDDDGDDGFLVEWAGRYDTILGLPVVGETNVFVGYRGGYFENEDENFHYMDHTVMAGFRVWFGGNSLLEFDRIGATLDAPNFGRWVGSGNILDE